MGRPDNGSRGSCPVSLSCESDVRHVCHVVSTVTHVRRREGRGDQNNGANNGSRVSHRVSCESDVCHVSVSCGITCVT